MTRGGPRVSLPYPMKLRPNFRGFLEFVKALRALRLAALPAILHPASATANDNHS